MKTQAEYYEQHKGLTDEKLLYELRGLNAYFMVRENGYKGPTRPDAADEKRALEQILAERGLENPGMQFGDLMRLELPPEVGGTPEGERPTRSQEKPLKSSFLDQKTDVKKEFLNKGVLQIIFGVILTIVGIGLSADMKGYFFYGAIVGGLAMLVVGIMNVSSYQKFK
ncbi:MAG: hypothetical protein AAF927_24200 [Bacteroidota bacterium]